MDRVEEKIGLLKSLANNRISVHTDESGNYTVNIKNTGKKIMICTVANTKRILIKKVDKKCAEFEALFDNKGICGSIVMKDEVPVGVVRKKNDKEYLEADNKVDIKPGDICYIKSEILCKDVMLYTENSMREISYKIIDFINNIIDKCVNDIYFTHCGSDASALSTAKNINPDYLFLIYCSDEGNCFNLGDGFGVVFKDTNAVIKPSVRDYMIYTAEKNNIKYQIYTGNSNPLLEQFSLINDGITVAGISLPCSGLGTQTEVININDLNSCLKLLRIILSEE